MFIFAKIRSDIIIKPKLKNMKINKLLLIVVVLFSALTMSCNSDNPPVEQPLNLDETLWEGDFKQKDSNDSEITIIFHDDDDGLYTIKDLNLEEVRFDYLIDGKNVWISGSSDNDILSGKWIILNKSEKDRLTLVRNMVSTDNATTLELTRKDF